MSWTEKLTDHRLEQHHAFIPPKSILCSAESNLHPLATAMWSPSHNYSRSITPDSSGCSDSEPESPSDARVFKAPAPLPEMWHTAFDSPPMDGTSTALEERSFSPDRATTSTAESTRRRFRYSPFRPATSASHRAQRAYARAIVASIPAADEELRQAVRDDVARATAGWNACGACIGEEEVTGQLARLGEVGAPRCSRFWFTTDLDRPLAISRNYTNTPSLKIRTFEQSR